MKLEISNHFTGAVKFVAEIDCEEDAPTSVKIGLAVKWAVKTGASLDGANLDGASLYRANLNGASLYRASLYRANLYRANLYRANLNGASLDGANLNGASLDGANLDGAGLNGASLDGANLDGASLYGANLYRANLYRANLYRANLNGASLNGASGINDFVKSIQIDTYPISYTAENIQIGCRRHKLVEWAAFSDAQIRAMDGKKALEWWSKYKEWIFQTIELCPAKPTGYEGVKQ